MVLIEYSQEIDINNYIELVESINVWQNTKEFSIPRILLNASEHDLIQLTIIFEV